MGTYKALFSSSLWNGAWGLVYGKYSKQNELVNEQMNEGYFIALESGHTVCE